VIRIDAVSDRLGTTPHHDRSPFLRKVMCKTGPKVAGA
jgi:hypothetical protein